MLELFMLETCPYCRKVINFMNENNIEYVQRNITEVSNKNELTKRGGKEQVPFIYDSENSKGLYESDDIIEYLKQL